MDFHYYSQTFLHFYTMELPRLVEKSIPTDNFWLADLGVGDGSLLVSLKLNGYLLNSNQVFAVDISQDRCNRLKDNTDFNILCSDVTDIPQLESQKYDYVICTQVIEHVDQNKLLCEINRILNSNGVLYIASVIKKKYGWWYYKNDKGDWVLDPTHLREYRSKQEFENVIKSQGFDILETDVTRLKLSIIEFLIRRVFVNLFSVKKVNSLFLKYKFLDYLRKKLYINPPGYYIIETIAKKSNIVLNENIV